MKRAWLSLIAAACTHGTESTQIITGTATASDALAVRAVSGSETVTAARVRSDGTFSLALPAGKQYSLEVLAASGVYAVSGVSFRVCAASAPIDLGDIGSGGDGCTLPPPPPPPPPGCDSTTGSGSGSDCPPPPPPPPACDPTTGCPCPPPWCDPTTDSGSGSGSASDCVPPPPPPCADPSDATPCQDPCVSDPQHCACLPPPPPGSGSGSGSDSGSGACWPPPGGGTGGGMSCDHPPGDIGCSGSNGT